MDAPDYINLVVCVWSVERTVSRCSEVQSADRRFIFLPFTAAPALSRLEPVIHEHQSRSFALFLQLNERCRRHLPYNSWHHSPSLFVLLCLPSALCHISSGWSIPISSNWWTSLRPKRSTSSSLNCEFRCLMSRGGGGGGKALCLSPQPLVLVNSTCWL